MHEAIFNSAEALAEHMYRSATAGVAQVMYDFRPNTVAGLQRVVDAVRIYHST